MYRFRTFRQFLKIPPFVRPKMHSAGLRGVSRIVCGWILIFLWLRCPCKISQRVVWELFNIISWQTHVWHTIVWLFYGILSGEWSCFYIHSNQCNQVLDRKKLNFKMNMSTLPKYFTIRTHTYQIFLRRTNCYESVFHRQIIVPFLNRKIWKIRLTADILYFDMRKGTVHRNFDGLRKLYACKTEFFSYMLLKVATFWHFSYITQYVHSN